jgi:hypothetical protein
LSFDKDLELLKLLKHFRFQFKQINPCKFAKIINKGDVVFFHPTDSGAGPNIRIHKFKRKFRCTHRTRIR